MFRRSIDRLGVILSFVSVVVALAAAEGALRLFGFSFRIYPERVEFGWPDPQTLTDRYMPDSDLFWVPKNYFEALRYFRTIHPLVVFMGDSCTEYGDYQIKFSHRFEARQTGRRLPYASLGVGGWSSYQGLRQLERDIIPLRPKVVTIYYGWNDHWYGFGVSDERVGALYRPQGRMFSDIRLVQLWIKTALVVLGTKPEQHPMRVSLPEYRNNLRRIARVALENGIRPVFLTAPSSHKRGFEPPYLGQRWISDLSRLVPLHQSYVQATRDEAAATGATLCDLAAAFEVLPEPERNRYLSGDGIHPSPEGHQKIAELLETCFSENGIMKLLQMAEPS